MLRLRSSRLFSTAPRVKNLINGKLVESSTSSWIPVQSAFAGLAIYDIDSLANRFYDGDDGCEHVPFHKGLRMFIVPKLVSG